MNKKEFIHYCKEINIEIRKSLFETALKEKPLNLLITTMFNIKKRKLLKAYAITTFLISEFKTFSSRNNPILTE